MEKTNKQSAKERIVGFFQSRAGRGIVVVAALALAYVFASWALDSGSLLDYVIAFILLIIAVRETAAIIRQSIRQS